MRVMIDGYALGMPQGTGLTRHALELAGALFDIPGVLPSVLFGVDAQAVPRAVFSAMVLQRLMTQPRHPLSRLPLLDASVILSHAAMAQVSSLMGVARVKRIHIEPGDLLLDTAIPLSSFDGLYNFSRLFDSAFSIAALTGRPLTVECSSQDAVPDLLHVTHPVPIRLKHVPTVTTVHDLIPITFPQSTQVHLGRYSRIVGAALKDSELICCVSEYAAQTVSRIFQIPERRLAVVYQSVDLTTEAKALSPEFVRSALAAHELEPGGYAVFTGAVEPKKNVDRLLTAHALSGTPLPLVVMGPRGWLSEHVEARMADARMEAKKRAGAAPVIRIPYLDRLSQLAILSQAKFLCFPSLAEGFGLPILEAMQLGVPVITSNHTGCGEIAGEAAFTVDPQNTLRLADAIHQLSSDDRTCKTLASMGQAQAMKFSKARYAERLHGAYLRALGG